MDFSSVEALKSFQRSSQTIAHAFFINTSSSPSATLGVMGMLLLVENTKHRIFGDVDVDVLGFAGNK